jgi:integrase
VLTILKAALNHSFQEGKVSSDDAWRRVKPYREADAAKIRYLTAAECRRLLDACEGPFRDLVRGALATGCRYGELGRIRVSDFDAQSRTVTIAKSKQSKPRHIALSDEGAAFFAALTAEQPRTALVFSRTDGEAWGASHQQRPLIEASLRAGLEPPCTFHILRHTYASALAIKGVPMRPPARPFKTDPRRTARPPCPGDRPRRTAARMRVRPWPALTVRGRGVGVPWVWLGTRRVSRSCALASRAQTAAGCRRA